MTTTLLEGELTPSDFLRQVAFDNDKLTDQFMQFYDSVGDNSESDSSDDEIDECSQTSSASSQVTVSQVSDDNSNNEIALSQISTHESSITSIENSIEGDDRPVSTVEQSSFEKSNEDNFSNEGSQSLFENSNKDDSNESDRPSTSNQMLVARCRSFKIVPPSARHKSPLNIQQSKRQKLSTQAPDSTSNALLGFCSKCGERPFDMLTIPCGHLSCTPCWEEWKIERRDDLKAKYRSERTLEKKIKELTCMFCHKPVKLIQNAFRI